MKKLLILPLIFSFSHQVFAAEPRVWTSYRNLAEIVKFDEFNAQPVADRDKVMLYPTITPQNKTILASNVIMTVVQGNELQTFKVGADERLLMPFKPSWYAGGATILINQPLGEKMDVGFCFDAIIPGGTKWPYASLMGSVIQANTLTKRLVGMKSLLFVSWKSVNLVFAKPAQLQLATRAGVRTLNTNTRTNTIKLKLELDLMKENPVITLSERPLSAVVDNR